MTPSQMKSSSAHMITTPSSQDSTASTSQTINPESMIKRLLWPLQVQALFLVDSNHRVCLLFMGRSNLLLTVWSLEIIQLSMHSCYTPKSKTQALNMSVFLASALEKVNLQKLLVANLVELTGLHSLENLPQMSTWRFITRFWKESLTAERRQISKMIKRFISE